MTITTPGIYPNITPAGYHRGITPDYALSASGIKILLNETPFDYRYRKRKPATDAMRLGDVAHQIALNQGKGFAISPYDDYRTKEAREWRDEQIGAGIIPIKQDAFDEASEIAIIIRYRINRALDGADYLTEVPFAWIEQTEHGETWCTGMMDVWCPERGIIIDPKITPYLHGDKARAHIGNMGWHWQNAWYRRGIGKIMPYLEGRVRFKNILVHPDDPHTSRVVEISEGWRAGAEQDCLRALATFAECQSTGIWPGYPEDEILDEPEWSTRMRLMKELEGEVE